MYLYFNSDGQLLEKLEHGPAPRAGTTNFEIFAFFENVDIERFYTNASLNLFKPDLEETYYPALLMSRKTVKFSKLPNEELTHFENGKTYKGFYFSFSDFTETQEVETLLDTVGLWSATIRLYGSNRVISVQGQFNFLVANGFVNQEETTLSIETLISNIELALAGKLNIDSTGYLRVIENIPEIGEGFPENAFNVGDILYNKDDKSFYKLNSLIVSNTNPEKIGLNLADLTLPDEEKITLLNGKRLATTEDVDEKSTVSASSVGTSTNVAKYLTIDGEEYKLSGSGGTDDFNELINRPKYNNQTMTGSTNIPRVVDVSGVGTSDRWLKITIDGVEKNIPTGELFIVNYGDGSESREAEDELTDKIIAAVSSGKVVYCKYNNKYYKFVWFNNSNPIFHLIETMGAQIVGVTYLRIVYAQYTPSGFSWNTDSAELAKISDIKNSTITIKQGDITKGSFTLNQNSNATIALDDGSEGTVKSVNDVEPDEDGNVELTASNIETQDNYTVQEKLYTLENDISVEETARQTADTNLSNRISAIESLGRFLAILDCGTGLPTSQPTTTPYTYRTGDYFRIGYVDLASNYVDYDSTHTYNTGDRVKYSNAYYICNEDDVTGAWDASKWTAHTLANYVPSNETQFTGTAFTTLFTGDAETLVDGTYFFDGTTWHLQIGSTSGKVKDVKILNSSIVNGGVATISYATTGQAGVGIINPAGGIALSTSQGWWKIVKATNDEIVAKTHEFHPIVPSSLNKAVMEGLGNNSLTWSDTYKANARNTIGASKVSVSDTGTATDEVNYIIIDGVEKKIGGSGGVTDVQLDGTSVVTDGVAEIEKASTSNLGVVKIGTYEGITTDNDGNLIANAVGETGLLYRITVGDAGFGFINTSNYDLAVKHALCDSDETSHPAYTDIEKAGARTKIGAGTGQTTIDYEDWTV